MACEYRTLNLDRRDSLSRNRQLKALLIFVGSCVLMTGCRAQQATPGPAVEFTRVPLADEGGPDRLDVIEGRVSDGRPGLRIILFARSGPWFVQPFADQPFTQIQTDSSWRSVTHLGTEYAALLVEADYKPPPSVEVLPGRGSGVLAVAIVKGVPVVWRRWWFLLLCALASLSGLLALYSYRLRRSARQLSLRFEERLAERTRISQELHDTFLQGVISASMQLHMAVDRLPEDLPAKPSLTHVLQVMGQVLDEGRSALQRLSLSDSGDGLDLEQAFSSIKNEFDVRQETDFRVIVEGRPRQLHPIIRDEVYRIGRQVLVNDFRRPHAKRIVVEVQYRIRRLHIIIRNDACGNNPQELLSAGEDFHGFAALRRRAEVIGARLRVRKHGAIGSEVQLTVPADIAYQTEPGSSSLLRWLAR
jgi:signal transduction histidine kinase